MGTAAYEMYNAASSTSESYRGVQFAQEGRKQQGSVSILDSLAGPCSATKAKRLRIIASAQRAATYITDLKRQRARGATNA